MNITKNIIVSGIHQKPILTDVFYLKNHIKKPVVIFAHGYKGYKDWGAWNLVANQFLKSNLVFVKFNFSHNGGTIEKPIDFSDLEAFGNNNFTKELDDLQSVIQWITQNDALKVDCDFDNINLIGHSRGGGIVLLKAASEPLVKKVITWSSVSDFGMRFPTGDALKKWQKDGVTYIDNARTHQKMPLYFQFYQNFNENRDKLNICSAVKSLKIPQLIIHGTADETVKPIEAENLHKWNGNSELFMVNHANHTFNSSQPWQDLKLPKELEKAVAKTIYFITPN